MELKGRQTIQRTYFGRQSRLMRSLEELLAQGDMSRPFKGLVVGVGIDEDFTRPVSYQPFELANMLERLGLADYRIDVADIDETALTPYRGAFLMPIHLSHAIATMVYGNDPHPEGYLGSFFPDLPKSRRYQKFQRVIGNGLTREERFLMVDIPSRVLARMNPVVADILCDPLPDKKYDVVLCTELLVHYKAPHESNAIRERLASLVRENGYLLSSPFPDFASGLTLLTERLRDALYVKDRPVFVAEPLYTQPNPSSL